MKKFCTIFFLSSIFLIGFHGHSQGQDYSYKVVQHDSLGKIQDIIFRQSVQNSPENVLVLYNINYTNDDNGNNIWDGYEVASYYQSKRNIPALNIFGIRAPTTSVISRAQYDSFFDTEGQILGIRQQVESILNDNQDGNGISLRSKIKYIVLTKGIPHRIKAYKSSTFLFADYSSVDASLALVFNGTYDINWTLKNPYYNQDPTFQGSSSFVPEFYTNASGHRLSFLVTRLDGYYVDDIKQMIDKAVQCDSTKRVNTFVIDDAQKPYDDMEEAYNNLKSIGANVYPDPWEDIPEPITSITDSVVGIVTHGVYAGLEPGYPLTQFSFKLVDGAIFSSYESLNGVSFSPNTQSSQGQVADFIGSGGSGGIGNAFEPYYFGIADESVLFPAYYSGYTFAEAAYMSLEYMDWTSVVVGDPLMRIGPKVSPQVVDDFRVIAALPLFNATRQAKTTVAEIVFSRQIDTLSLPDFYNSPGGEPLRSFVDGNYLYLWPESPLTEGLQARYVSANAIYSVDGDSIASLIYALFNIHQVAETPVAPVIYRNKPSGIDVNQSTDIILYFSQRMLPETIYPLLGNVSLGQTHNWNDNTILTVEHTPFLPGTYYSFYIDAHAKSVNNIGFSQNYNFNFVTEFNFVFYDIDADSYLEYAHNLNGSLIDGYEVYADSGGVQTSVLDTSDINSDNQKEYFIQIQGNTFPTYFWNPNAVPYTGYFDQCVAMDDDEDGVLEYAFDAAGSGYFTKVYDPNGIENVRDINFILHDYYPDNHSTNISLFTELILDFSVPVNYANVEENLSINPVAIFESIQTDLGGTRLIIHFADTLLEYTNYVVTVNQGLTSIRKDSLFHDYVFSFQTGSRDPLEAPRVLSFFPGDSLQLIDNTPTVRFIFSLPMDTTLLFPIITDTSSGVFWDSFWSDDRSLYLFPSQELQDTTQHSFTLSPNLQGMNGVNISGKDNFNFISGQSSTDTQLPSILQVIPSSGNNIPDNQEIRVIFSEWINDSPNLWFQAQSGLEVQDYNWVEIGKNMFSFSGNPVWKPQSTLDVLIQSENLHDNNQNSLFEDVEISYFVVGMIVQRDIDNDNVMEYVVDGNQNLSDGLEIYQDPGGILTSVIFSDDIDGDSFNDFLISDASDSFMTTWYPLKPDSGILGYTEKISQTEYEVSIDSDDLVEFLIVPSLSSIEPVIPRLRSHYPENASDNVPLFAALSLQFNTSVDAFSVIQSTTIEPTISGAWSLENNLSRLIFTPNNGWKNSTIYSLNLEPGYRATNGIEGETYASFSFRITDELEQPGEISWQFPQTGDSAHYQSNYFVAFTAEVDTTVKPSYTIIQNFQTFPATSFWISDTLLQINPPSGIQTGDAVLTASGEVRFLTSPPLALNSAVSFIIADTLNLKVVRALFITGENTSVNQTFSFIFNQPLDSLSFQNIELSKINGTDTASVTSVISTIQNFITLRTSGLEYATNYLLELRRDLRGVSGTILNENIAYNFTTEEILDIEDPNLQWQQAGNFLIFSWPVANPGFCIFELYLTDNYQSEPDTISYSNLYNRTENPSWLFNLKYIDEKSYLNVRLLKSNKTYWSKPAILFNHSVKAAYLLSLPIARSIHLEDLNESQDRFNIISQWDASIEGWRSAKYFPDKDRWSSNLNIERSRGILGRAKSDGYLCWLQSIPDSFIVDEEDYQTGRFRSVYSPYDSVRASDLAAFFGDATKLAVWNNSAQGWNEAVFDTIFQGWANNFYVNHLEPIYVYTSNGFQLAVNTGQSLLPKAHQKARSYSNSFSSFPSKTHLIHLPANVIKMETLKNDELGPPIIGCGLDLASHIAYINLGNLSSKENWQFNFYDAKGNLLDVYQVKSDDKELHKIPTAFKLGLPYPNPFNSTVSIPLEIPERTVLKIKVYNILGQLVYNEEARFYQPQTFVYRWDSGKYGNIATGIYFIRINFKNNWYTRKVLLIK